MKRPPTRRLRASRPRKGFSLIETMVGMTIFAVVSLGMAKMATAVALKGRTNDITSKRNAALTLEANKFGAVPFASLATWSTADKTFSRGTFTYTRRITLVNISPTRYGVKIVVTPTADPSKKDSLMFDRTKPPAGSPLCLGC